MQHRVPAAIATLIASAGAVFAQDWPAFRGPTGDGISTESSVPLTWSSTDNVRRA